MPLTFGQRTAFTYPSGLQAIHANMTSDSNGFYFASDGIVHAFDWDGTRDSDRDVTLAGLSTSVTIWGFTKNGSNWAVLTRETGTNVIGMVREYTSTGTAVRSFSVPDAMTGISETFRAPKGLAASATSYYVRVVRSVAGNMRINRFSLTGTQEESILLAEASPGVLSDMTEINGILFIIQQREFRAYATRLSDDTHALISNLQTNFDTRNNSPWAATGRNNTLYVADRGGYLYSYTGVPPATAVWGTPTYASGKLSAELTFYGSDITGISASDFNVLNDSNLSQTGWTFDTTPTTATDGTAITISATPPANTNGNFKFRLNITSVRAGGSTTDNVPDAAVLSAEVAVDNRAVVPPTVATAAWSGVSYTSGKLSGTLTFSGANVTGIAAGDFSVLNASDVAQSGWTFDTPSATATAGTGITIAATPPSNTNGNFKLRLNATSVRSDGSATDNAPASAVASGAVAVDNRPAVVASASWAAASYTNGKLQAILSFNQAVTGISTSDFEILNASDVAQTGWTFDATSSTANARQGRFIRATPPSNTNGSFKISLKATSVRGPRATSDNSPASATSTAAVAVDNRPPAVVATATWSDASFSHALNAKLTAKLTFNSAITGLTTSDIEIINASNQVQSGWVLDSVPSTVAANTGITVDALPPQHTNGNFRFRLKANSVRGARATTDNSPAANSDSSAVHVQNILVLERTLAGSFGGLSVHANLVASGNLLHVVHNNVIQAFSTTPTTFTRASASDITLTGHSTSIQTWGFDRTGEGDWVIMTRQRNTQTNSVGRVYVYSEDGTERKLMFDVPSSHTAIAGETFSAPKTVTYWRGAYYVNVARSVSGGLRFLAFDEEGTLDTERTFVLTETTPSTIRDAGADDLSPLYILTPGSPVGIAYPIDPRTGAEVPNERLVGTQLATGAEGISISSGNLYVGTLNSVYVYSGVPDIASAISKGGGGSNFNILQLGAMVGRMDRNLNRRAQRRRR